MIRQILTVVVSVLLFVLAESSAQVQAQSPSATPTVTITVTVTITSTITATPSRTPTITATGTVTATPLRQSVAYVAPSRADFNLGYYKIPIVLDQTTTGVKSKVTAFWGHKSINLKITGTATVDIDCQSHPAGSVFKHATAASASTTILTDMVCDTLWCDVLTCTSCHVSCSVDAWR